MYKEVYQATKDYAMLLVINCDKNIKQEKKEDLF